MITILRLGHRPMRDKRVTTHVALVARALGASRILVSTPDPELVTTVTGVVRNFGGRFEIETGTGYVRPMKDFKGIKIHLTMYGAPLHETMDRFHMEHPDQDPFTDDMDVMIIVGAEKVPRKVYELADLNVSVSNQPHSEIAALTLLMDRLSHGRWEEMDFRGGKMKIIPSERGKSVETVEWVPTVTECDELLGENHVSHEVIEHERAVSALAVAMAGAIAERGGSIDVDVVRAASLLHDIGRSLTHGPLHALEGAGILEEAGVSERVLACVRNHMGAGIGPEEAARLGLPPGDYTPRSLEEMVVAHADNLIFGKERRTLGDIMDKFEAKGLHDAAKRIRSLHEYLEERLGASIDDIEPARE